MIPIRDGHAGFEVLLRTGLMQEGPAPLLTKSV